MKKLLASLCGFMLVAGSISADEKMKSEAISEDIVLEEALEPSRIALEEEILGETSDAIGMDAPLAMEEVEELRFRIPYDMASITCDGECLYVTVSLKKPKLDEDEVGRSEMIEEDLEEDGGPGSYFNCDGHCFEAEEHSGE